MAQPEDLLRLVSANVRRLRLARGWSQQELGRRAGVSRGMLIRIESGQDNVSLATLGRIALAFGVPFTEVVLAPAGTPVWQGARPGTRAALLGSFVNQRMTDLFEWTLAPGDRYQGEADQAGTRELVYVVKGTLVLDHPDGTRTLKAGDSAGFASDRPVTFGNGGRGELRFILAVVG
jgi:transcriptional regulator with XRE-family HTH domain